MMNFSATFCGTVMKGALMGRKIGFPTLNLACTECPVAEGVYACQVKTSMGMFKGIMYYGIRPVRGEKDPVIDIHLLDFGDDLYGQVVVVNIIEKIREMGNFEVLSEFKRQIRRDIETVRKIDIVL